MGKLAGVPLVRDAAESENLVLNPTCLVDIYCVLSLELLIELRNFIAPEFGVHNRALRDTLDIGEQLYKLLNCRSYSVLFVKLARPVTSLIC